MYGDLIIITPLVRIGKPKINKAQRWKRYGPKGKADDFGDFDMKSEADPKEIKQGWQRQVANLPVTTISLRELLLIVELFQKFS